MMYHCIIVNFSFLYRWAVLAILLVFLLAINISVGSISIPLTDITSIITGHYSQNTTWTDIILHFRLPKAITCILAGAALSLSGLQMQTLFRNALAGPDVLGLTSGASLSVSLVLLTTSSATLAYSVGSSWTIAIAASLGCALVFLVMLAVSSRLKDNASLLIVGLMIGAGTSSIVSVLQFISNAEELQTYLIWTFGSLSSLSWNEIQVLSLVLLIGTVLSFLSVKSLNAWVLGDNYAQSIGVNVKKARILIIISACILTGAVTAFCGPIAFVGLAVPHLIKLLIKSHDHKLLIPGVMLGGASLVLFCDILTHLPGSTQVFPINAVTALIGAPVVIWVIMRNRLIQF